jgi:Flp pilus assembly pilin Flp/chromosome segregation ATPase
MVEYGLIIGIIAVILVAALTVLKAPLGTLFSNIASIITGNTPAAPAANNAVDLSQSDPVVSKVIQQLNNARQLAADNQNLTVENQRLTTESATKDQTILGLQATVNSLTDANQKLTGDNDTLKQTNATQAVSIANLTKENDNLKSRTANQIVLEQKVSEYEGVITRHDKERVEMQKELDTLRITSRDNEARAKKLEADILKITRERDYYQSQIMALQNAIDFNPTAVNNAESRTR